MTKCPTCGTHTEMHWPGCALSKNRSLAPAIKQRTASEKQAYLQGFEACLKTIRKEDVGRDNADVVMKGLHLAEAAFKLMKEIGP